LIPWTWSSTKVCKIFNHAAKKKKKSTLNLFYTWIKHTFFIRLKHRTIDSRLNKIKCVRSSYACWTNYIQELYHFCHVLVLYMYCVYIYRLPFSPLVSPLRKENQKHEQNRRPLNMHLSGYKFDTSGLAIWIIHVLVY